MRTETNSSWWRQLGAISRGMLFLDGHIATAGAAKVARPSGDTDHAGIGRAAMGRQAFSVAAAKRADYAKQVRQMTALSLFR